MPDQEEGQEWRQKDKDSGSKTYRIRYMGEGIAVQCRANTGGVYWRYALGGRVAQLQIHRSLLTDNYVLGLKAEL